MKKSIRKSNIRFILAAVVAAAITTVPVMAVSTGRGRTAVEAVEKSEYTRQQYLNYFKEETGTRFGIMVYANASFTKFQLKFNYYGMDVTLDAEKTGNHEFYITNGEFFQTDGQNVIQQALKNAKWI